MTFSQCIEPMDFQSIVVELHQRQADGILFLYCGNAQRYVPLLTNLKLAKHFNKIKFDSLFINPIGLNI